MIKEEIFKYEEERLAKVIELINKKIVLAERRFREHEQFKIGFKEGMRGTQFTRQSMMSMYATEKKDLESIVDNPYFGRFEFVKNGSTEPSIIYIGKKAITDNDGKIISYDWRSDVCSMYYDYNIGDAEYTSFGKTEKGKITSKRQIIIKKGKLETVEEQDTISDDLILLKYLSENADSRLRSIIATIQREQNKIIRSPLRNNYIIQGVAGSGKTTVALHRIAYLLYTEARNISESEFMILGPNKYFLNYISELLPDLDIKNVSQSTFDDIALNILKNKVKLESKNETLQNVLDGKVNPRIIEYKNSLMFLRLIEEFLNNYVMSHLTKPIEYEDIELCGVHKLSRLSNGNNSYSDRVNRFIKELVNNVKENSDDLSHNIWLKYREEFLKLSKTDPRRQEIIDITNKINDEVKKGCQAPIKEYFKFMKISPLNLYQAFIENIDMFSPDIPVDIEEFKTYTLNKLKKKQIGSDDIAAILFIEYLMNGINAYDKCHHLVIDEAQDLSLSQYYILRRIFPNANFDVFGDVNQSIYDYQAISDWDTLNKSIFNDNAKLLYLDKSYRTTKQIADTSNLVLDTLNYHQADCIARNGSDIVVEEQDNKTLITEIVKQLDKLLSKDYQTIAIICKDDEETKKVYDKLTKLGININIIKEKNESYQGGVSVLPSYLSKGLEFDAVILYNANDINYQENPIDQKLLYVAITRAMHELYINYNGNISPSLKSLIKTESKILVRK